MIAVWFSKASRPIFFNRASPIYTGFMQRGEQDEARESGGGGGPVLLRASGRHGFRIRNGAMVLVLSAAQGCLDFYHTSSLPGWFSVLCELMCKCRLGSREREVEVTKI